MGKKGAVAKGTAKAKAKRGRSKEKTKTASQDDLIGHTYSTAFSMGTTQSLAMSQGDSERPGSPAAPSDVASMMTTRLSSPQKPKPTYAGPRPDEELLEVVHGEVHQGDGASIEYVYELIRADEDVNQRNVLGLTPLAIAAVACNGPLVSLLLERGAKVDIRNVHNMELPLHYAARTGNRIVCQLLAETSRALGLIDSPNATGWPPLHLAVACGHMSAINVLIKNGADVCSHNEHSGRFTALHVAVRLGFAEFAEALLDRDAQVDALDSYRRGALHFAAARADYPCVSLLVRSKADPLRRDPGGKTAQDLVPLEHAGRDKVVTMLAAYSRPAPQPFRTDLRFDRGDKRDLDPLNEPIPLSHAHSKPTGGAFAGSRGGFDPLSESIDL